MKNDIYYKKCINDGILALGCGISIPLDILKVLPISTGNVPLLKHQSENNNF